MDKQNYFNTINLQVESLFELVQLQADRCFSEETLLSVLPKTQLQSLRRMIVTGCGDSYSAAGAMAPAIQALSGVECIVPDPMEFCRFYDREEMLDGHSPDEVLVIAISASGGSARIVEIMKHASDCGVPSMIITNNPSSAGALAAKAIYCVETPELCNTPGLRSYFASLIALSSLGCYLAVTHGRASLDDLAKAKKALVAYVLSYQPVYGAIEDSMFELAKNWKAFERFEIIGDQNEFFSAQFVEEKFIECASVHCSHADSEDWCHINFFLRNPETIGTVFHVLHGAPNFDRIRESVRVAVELGRPVLVISDADKSQFADSAAFCAIPATPIGYDWLSPVMSFAPGSILGAYCAALADKWFFGGRYDFRAKTWHRGE